jgi:hypothetical protein
MRLSGTQTKAGNDDEKKIVDAGQVWNPDYPVIQPVDKSLYLQPCQLFKIKVGE